MKVTVLGCGPSGLIAAHVARLAGHELRVLSVAKKSHLNGAQYLHKPIFGLPTTKPEPVSYEMVGSFTGYGKKVYGNRWDGLVSPEEYEGDHMAYDIRAAYDWLWLKYRQYVQDAQVEAHMLPYLLSESDLVVSSLPASALCVREHTFRSQQIWAAGDAPGLGIAVPYPCPEQTVICNGDRDVSWYRVSNVFGHKTVEWPEAVRPPLSTAALVQKPLDNNCDCWPELLRVGRYGKWKKGVLVHHVYDDAMGAMA